MRLLAIGDIHGCFRALDTLSSEVDFQADDVVVTLGDYADRGPDSKKVLEFLIALQSRCVLIPLRGNHEVMMLAARNHMEAMAQWRLCGGVETLNSYDRWERIPKAHWDFISRTRPYYESERDIFVHANVIPTLAMKDQPDYMLYWEFLTQDVRHQSGKRMICGHTSQKDGRPLSLAHAVCVDTWAHGEGWLTCLDAGTGRYWQANQRGETRRDVLEPP